ncbi:MAG: lipoyl(octanoyl) transferase LipB [Acidobacteriaceae bacterium]
MQNEADARRTRAGRRSVGRKTKLHVKVVSVLYLGRMEYAPALALQQKLIQQRKEGTIGDVLLLLEHTPVLTMGRNARRENILLTDQELLDRHVQVVDTNRGGDVTYHGPGQLVGYPIFDLRSFDPRLGVLDFVRRMEEAIIRVCAEFGLLTERVPGRTGVWTKPSGSLVERKIAAIGVHISNGVTSHGFALNVTTDLKDFDWIVPCGIADRGVTSLERESEAGPGELKLPAVAEGVSRQFGRVFGTQMLWLESLADLHAAVS